MKTNKNGVRLRPKGRSNLHIKIVCRFQLHNLDSHLFTANVVKADHYTHTELATLATTGNS